MAKIIATAGVRLVADGAGIDTQIRRILIGALRDAGSADLPSLTGPIRDDADRTANHLRSVLGGIQGSVSTLAGGFARAMTSGLKLTLVGAAAGSALAGITSLTTGVIGLAGALGQAAGVAGLLPAALLAVQAGAATLRIGLTGIEDSFKAVGGTAQEFADSIEDLAPAAQSFMREIRALQPAFDGLRLDVQQRLFAGLSDSVAGLADRYLPIANSLFVSIAGSMNQAGRELAGFAQQGEVVGQVNNMADNLRATFQNLAPALTPAVSGLLDFTEVGTRFMPALAAEVTALSTRFGEFMRNAAGSGQLEAFFLAAIQNAKDLFAALRDFGAGLGGIFSAAETAGTGFLSSLRAMAASFREFTTSAQGQEKLIAFFAAMRQITQSLLPVLGALADVIVSTVAPILANLARTIGPALVGVVEGIGGAFEAARPGIDALAEGVAAFLSAIGPVLPVLGELAGVIAGALGQAFETLAPVVVKVAEVFSRELAAILPQITPILTDVAEAIGRLLEAAIPLVPIFFDLVAAILPVIPPLLDMVTSILPPLIELIQAAMPAIRSWAELFVAVIQVMTSVASVILSVLIPPIKLIITVVGAMYSFVAGIFTSMFNLATSIFNGIRNVITAVWSGISSFFSSILSTIGNAVRNAFNAVVTTIGNALSSARNAVTNGLKNVVQFFVELPGRILSALGNLGQLLYDAGVNLIKGFINGIKNMIANAVNAVADMVSSVVSTVTSGLSIFSPSRVFRDLGQQTGRGLVLGIEDMIPATAEAAAALAAAVRDGAGSIALDPSLRLGAPGSLATAASAASAGAAAVILNQTNIMRPGADVSTFANEVYRNGAQQLAGAASTIPVAQQGVQRGLPADDYLTGVSL